MNTLPIIIVVALLVVCILLFTMYLIKGRAMLAVNEELRTTSEALRLTQSERDNMQHEVVSLRQMLEL